MKPYFDLAQAYTFADRMFQSNQGPSMPAHQYLISGSSTPTHGGAYDDYQVGGNPQHPLVLTGCREAPPTETVPLIDADGNMSVHIWPCFDRPTMMDLLVARGLNWRYYAQSTGSLRTAGRLGAVTWVVPSAANSDHPLHNTGGGPSWVASVVNAIGTSKYWKDTAVFVTWDDWGGWYDHVAPTIRSSYEFGFRYPRSSCRPGPGKATSRT